MRGGGTREQLPVWVEHEGERPAEGIALCPKCLSLFRDGAWCCPHDGARLEAFSYGRPDQLLGRSIDDAYVLTRLIGTGGMGRVYRARRLSDGRRVALKLMFEDLGRRSEMQLRFDREVGLARTIRHPNVVGVLDGGCGPGKPTFIVMELVKGPTLEALIRDSGRLPAEKALRITQGILRGLAYVHARGIVHRDLKPANVLLERSKRGELIPRVADFGLARPFEPGATSTITRDGAVNGSPAYMAPEQVLGFGPHPAADLYAVGATLHAMIEGRPPLAGSALQMLQARLATPGFRISPSDGLPGALVVLMERLMHPDPAGRPPSASAALEEVDALLVLSEASTREISLPGRASTGTVERRRRMLWIVASLLLAALGVGIQVANWYQVADSSANDLGASAAEAQPLTAPDVGWVERVPRFGRVGAKAAQQGSERASPSSARRFD